MALSDLLPTPPWKGPPLPAFLARNPGTWKAWTSPEEYTKVAEKQAIGPQLEVPVCYHELIQWLVNLMIWLKKCI